MIGNEHFGKNLCFGRKCLFYRSNNRLDTQKERERDTNITLKKIIKPQGKRLKEHRTIKINLKKQATKKLS